MISLRAFCFVVLLFVALFSIQYHYFPQTLFYSAPPSLETALAPPEIPEPIRNIVTPKDEPLEDSEPVVVIEPEIEEPEIEEPIPEENDTLTLKDILYQGTRNLTHYRYEVLTDEYPYVLDHIGNSTLIRYKRNRFLVPNLMIDRVFLNHTDQTAVGTCVTDWVCARSGGLYLHTNVTYELFNVASVYDVIGPHLYADVVEQKPSRLMNGRKVTDILLSDNYTVVLIDEYQFPIGLLNEDGVPVFSANVLTLNAESELHLFSFSVKDTFNRNYLIEE